MNATAMLGYKVSIKRGEIKESDVTDEFAGQMFAQLLAIDDARISGADPAPHFAELRRLGGFFRGEEVLGQPFPRRAADWPYETVLTFETDRGYDLQWVIDGHGLGTGSRGVPGQSPRPLTYDLDAK